MLSTLAAVAVAITGPTWAQGAVSEMRVPVTADQTVVIAPCPGYEGAAACNFVTPDSPIYIDVPAPFDTPAQLREVLYRELGGRFETVAMYPWAVEHFARIVRRPSIMRDGGEREAFEDAYADCALGLTPRRSTLQHPDERWIDPSGYDPTRRQHTRVCRLIRRVGAHARMATPVTSRSSRP
jgi:hypothetical protein